VETTGAKLGQHLRAVRLSRKLSARRAAQLAGITQGYLSQIENGLYVPSARTISKLARAYGIAEVELLLSAGIIKELMLSRSEEGQAELEPVDPEIILQLEGSFEKLLLQTRQVMTPLSTECLVPLFDCNGSAQLNASGEPIGIHIPQHFCSDDPEAFLLEIDNDELTPLVFRGDWVIVSPKAQVRPNEVAVLHDGLRFYVRKYGKLGGMVGFHASATRFPSWTMQDLTERGISVAGRALRVINRELGSQIAAPDSFQSAST
jgi:transcriptional regulator with XRE-family HTH domain